MRYFAIALMLFFSASAFGKTETEDRDSTNFSIETIEERLDDLDEGKVDIMHRLENMPNVEVGKGVTFRPKNNSYEMTIRFRMQNMLGMTFRHVDGVQIDQTEAQVKRLRLRFDGYLFSPKFVYSIQLGFTGYDAEPLPNGKMNIVRDAVVYFIPNSTWNIGFGQTKIKASRARVNSSSALQFVDRSIVNSEFTVDRDFGLFGEYNLGHVDSPFALSAKGSITLGEGRNWSVSPMDGFAYTGRLELYPLGRFHSNGELMEGDIYYETTPKLVIGGAYSFNHHAIREQGQKGSMLPDGEYRNIGSYFVDMVFKYKGFGLVADYMGRLTYDAPHIPNPDYYIYTGSGLNVQASYLFNKKWEVALRNSTMFPDDSTIPFVGYSIWNQTTLGVTRYIIGHSLKVQLDVSYNDMADPINPLFDRWNVRFQLELGL